MKYDGPLGREATHDPRPPVDEQIPMERREVYFSGRVQGVGFRYTARALALRTPLVGFVQNLRDGRVLLVVEGSAAQIERLISAIQEEMDRYIESTDVQSYPATGEFTEFEVRR